MSTPASSRTTSRASSRASSSAHSTLDPTAKVFTPTKLSFPTDEPAAPKGKKTLPPIQEGDVGCFLCDDGLWCPMCSSEEDGSEQSKEPETPRTSLREEDVASFHRTPGHEREAKRKARRKAWLARVREGKNTK